MFFKFCCFCNVLFALVVIRIMICSFAAARTNVCDTAVGQVVSGDLLCRYPLCLLLVFWFLCLFSYFLSYFEKLCVSSGASLCLFSPMCRLFALSLSAFHEPLLGLLFPCNCRLDFVFNWLLDQPLKAHFLFI